MQWNLKKYLSMSCILIMMIYFHTVVAIPTAMAYCSTPPGDWGNPSPPSCGTAQETGQYCVASNGMGCPANDCTTVISQTATSMTVMCYSPFLSDYNYNISTFGFDLHTCPYVSGYTCYKYTLTKQCTAGQTLSCTSSNCPFNGQQTCVNGYFSPCSCNCPTGGCDCTNGDTQQCYDGPGGPSGPDPVMPCMKGTKTCTNGRWSDCIGQVLPQPGVCGKECSNNPDVLLRDLCCKDPICCGDPNCCPNK